MATFSPSYRKVFFYDIHWNLTDLANIKNIEIESEVFWPVSISYRSWNSVSTQPFT